MAAALGLHPGSFVRLFSHEVGSSPQRYAMTWRLEHAATLLLETDDSIEHIATACGFGDRHHFTRAFTRHWHCPPAGFRQRSRQ